MCTTIWLGSSPNGSVFRLRKTLMNLGITKLSALRVRYKSVVEEIVEERRAVELARRAKQEKQAQERAKALYEKTMDRLGRVCACGNASAATCSFQKCAKCCQGPCVRHQKGL